MIEEKERRERKHADELNERKKRFRREHPDAQHYIDAKYRAARALRMEG